MSDYKPIEFSKDDLKAIAYSASRLSMGTGADIRTRFVSLLVANARLTDELNFYRRAAGLPEVKGSDTDELLHHQRTHAHP